MNPQKRNVIPGKLFDGAFLRTARKPHRCDGGYDGQQRTRCDRTIERGEQYVEYLGESAAYQSGKRYHLEPCARQQGLIEEECAE